MNPGLMSGKRGLDHGRRQRSLDRLGHRPGARRAGGGARLHLPGRSAGQAGQAAGRKPRLAPVAALRRRGRRLARRGVRQARRRMGRARFRRPLHRLFRSQRAQGPLRRHDARELRPHHGDLRLLVHRGRQARRGADAERRIDADADLRRLDPGDAQLQRDGRRQGGAGGQRALSRRRLRSSRHSRSTPSPPARSAPSPAPASPTRASCSISSATIRRCAAP